MPHQEDPEAFRDFTRRMSNLYDVILPIAEDTEYQVSQFSKSLNCNCSIPIPDTEALRVTNDKSLTMRFASTLDVPIPFTISGSNEDDILPHLDKIHYPAVVKLAEESSAQIFPRYRIANSRGELLEAFRHFAKMNVVPLIQEYVKGNGLGAFLLFNKYSELIACFTHRRIIEYPIGGGFSAFAESILHPEAIDISLKLLQNLNWKGVAMVEFKLMADGSLRLMEINPRFWGSISLAVFSGVDFPTMLIETFHKRKCELSGKAFPPYNRRYMIRANVLAKSLNQAVTENKFGETSKKLLRAFEEPHLVRFEDINSDIGPLFSQIYFNAYDRVATALAKAKKKTYLSLGRQNLDYITPNVAVGGENNVRTLEREGFQTIIDLREHGAGRELKRAEDRSIKYFNFPTPDNRAPRQRDLKLIVDRVSEAVASGRKVIIHCSEGRGRAPTVACAYLMSTGVRFSDSTDILRSKRSLVNFTDAQLAALESFSRNLKEGERKDEGAGEQDLEEERRGEDNEIANETKAASSDS